MRDPESIDISENDPVCLWLAAVVVMAAQNFSGEVFRVGFPLALRTAVAEALDEADRQGITCTVVRKQNLTDAFREYLREVES
jgi:hypothetical protein